MKRRLVQFLLKDPDVMLYHDEPIYMNGRMLGRTTSGAYGHALGGAVGLGYVSEEAGALKDMIGNAEFEIEVAGRRIPASASLAPMYDPKSLRVKA